MAGLAEQSKKMIVSMESEAGSGAGAHMQIGRLCRIPLALRITISIYSVQGSMGVWTGGGR